MKEIGSEFWEIPESEKENDGFLEAAKWFLSGRTALRYIIADIKERYRFRTVGLPSWCCDSMIKPFLEAGIEVLFYTVYMRGSSLSANIAEVLHCDAVLVMDYFGYVRDLERSDYKGIFIRDLTHSVFSDEYEDADYFFGSLRKWCGIWTGGFAWSRRGWRTEVRPRNPSFEYIDLRRKAMLSKAEYIQGINDSREYLSWFSKAEEILDEAEGIAYAAGRDLDRIKRLDIDRIKTTRRENAKRLLGEVSELAIFPEILPKDCPLFVPILVPGGRRDELCAYLIQEKIYCPKHWPLTDLHYVPDKTRSLYEDELSLVCDQRYTAEDMDYIGKKVQAFLRR